MYRTLGLVRGTLIVFSLFAVPVFAFDLDEGVPTQRSAASPSPPQLSKPNVFGTNDNILQIPAAAFSLLFQAATPPDIRVIYESNGYVHPSGIGGALWAAVTLPAGVNISSLGLYGYDTNASEDVTAQMRGLEGGSDTPSSWSIATVSSTDSPGYKIFRSDSFSLTVNGETYCSEGCQYVVYVTFPVADGTLQFKGVDVWWNRQISPAPDTASFSDVPTSHPFFKEIEAMAASGITTGYADGTFKPGATVTRQAMAAFLSRALGLHWDH
jgi:hypothetical protein